MGQHRKKRPNTRWHTLFGALLDSMLTPVGVEVLLDLPVGYDYFYRESQGLTAHDVHTVVISAKTPHRGTLRRFGYTISLKPGVYQSTAPLLGRIVVVVSNQLEDTVYNAPVKCFASRKTEQRHAFALLQQYRGKRFSQRFWWLLNGLVGYFFITRRDAMQIDLTPEYITELGKIWGDAFLAHIPLEQRLAGLKPEERLAGLKPEEIERYLRKIMEA